jgi:hypothetical protein
MISIYDNDFLVGLGDFFTGGAVSAGKAREKAKKAGAEYKTSMENIAKTTKSAKDLYQEGKEAASASANNQAAIAKRNAKAAAMQGSGSKLMSAIQAAQAASDASSAGYDNAAANYTSLAANQNAREQQLKASGVEGKYNADIAAAGYDAEAGKRLGSAVADTAKIGTEVGSYFTKNKKE